jgi:hypothetical protein
MSDSITTEAVAGAVFATVWLAAAQCAVTRLAARTISARNAGNLEILTIYLSPSTLAIYFGSAQALGIRSFSKV